MRRKLAAGNWKMTGLAAELSELDALPATPEIDVLLCPPATLIARMVAKAEGTDLAVGGQDCHTAVRGAHTGDVSAAMIADAGGTYVIVGHSERRQDHGETNELVRDKTAAAIAAGLTAVVCIGESEEQYKAGDTLDVVGEQLTGSLPDGVDATRVVVAYEPVWAIGTGLVPTMDEIGTVHGFIRSELAAWFGNALAQRVRILYGGSVKPGNAAEIFAIEDVDGALVGGASLKGTDFAGIIQALNAA
jgi:triosephosphate isomerase